MSRDCDELEAGIESNLKALAVISFTGSLSFFILFSAIIIYKIVKQKTRKLIWLQLGLLLIASFLNLLVNNILVFASGKDPFRADEAGQSYLEE